MAKIRVYELAKELGVSSKVVLMRLNDLGEFVRSASSQVEATAVRRLAESIKSNPPAWRQPGGPRPSNNPFGSTSHRPAGAAGPDPLSEAEQARRAAAQLFGVRPEDVKLARQVPQKRGGPRRSPQGPQPDSWARNLIDPETKRAWIDAGLGPGDGDRARRCAEARLTPEDLLRRVQGRRVIDRIRGGDSIPAVAALLAEYK